MKIPLFLEQASTGAREVDHLLYCLLGVAAFFLLVTIGPMVFFAFRYRRGRRAERRIIRTHTFKLELTWTLIPFFVGMGLFAYSAAVYFRLRHPPAEAMEIHVVGKQWMWKVQHPEGKREINSLHVPEGVPVKLLMTSEDVIHSFFIPAFRNKQDVLPGYYTTLWFVPVSRGEFSLFCAEYCGTEHARMIGKVTVLSPSDYQKWLQTGTQEEGPVLAGARLFRELGCSGCHVGSPVIHAPELRGVYQSVVQLEGGRTVVADERYLRDSIVLPNRDVVLGYKPIMPSYQGRLSEGELMALVAYLKSLSLKGGGERSEKEFIYPIEEDSR